MYLGGVFIAYEYYFQVLKKLALNLICIILVTQQLYVMAELF